MSDKTTRLCRGCNTEKSVSEFRQFTTASGEVQRSETCKNCVKFDQDHIDKWDRIAIAYLRSVGVTCPIAEEKRLGLRD